jgi:LysR family hydrogen peroxide-inducible transcriptional activator
MNLQQLEYILAVDQYKHFIKAAEACHVTQPTLSMMIQKLETELGIKIFDRSKQPVLATPAGKLALEQARKILFETQKMQDLARLQQSSLNGTLRIGIIPTLAPYLAHRFVNRFLAKYPDISLTVSEHITSSIVKKLKKNQLDVGILVSPLGDSSILEWPLFYEPLSVYSSHGFSKTYLLPEDISPDELLLLEEGHCLKSQIMNLCELRKQSLSRLNYQSGSLETLIRLVSAGQGVTILPALTVETLSEQQKKQVFQFQAPVPVREVSLAVHRNFIKSDLIAALKAEILAGVPKEYQSKEGTLRLPIHV